MTDQYIITEEQLCEISVIDRYTTKMGNRLYKIRSHPYNPQEQREKVLDDGIALIQKRIDGIFDTYRGETIERLTERPYHIANGMGEAILILKELRQGGE